MIRLIIHYAIFTAVHDAICAPFERILQRWGTKRGVDDELTFDSVDLTESVVSVRHRSVFRSKYFIGVVLNVSREIISCDIADPSSSKCRTVTLQ